MPALLSKAEELVKRNQKLFKTLLIVALLVFVIYFFIYQFNVFRLLNATQEKKLEAYPLTVRLRVRALLNAIINAGYSVIITSAVRANGNDPHTRKHAIDINIISNATGKQYGMETPKAEWLATGIPDIIIKHGFRWGGNFRTPYMYNGTLRSAYDPVHADIE